MRHADKAVFDRMVVRESTGVRLVDQGRLCGRGVRVDDIADDRNDCTTAGSRA